MSDHFLTLREHCIRELFLLVLQPLPVAQFSESIFWGEAEGAITFAWHEHYPENVGFRCFDVCYRR